ncbi:MAG TPA: glutathione S-transferase family protein [Solirubrobacteraceae bacterium]|nr:glutathione S-transferase family protein [Solirubrobacteraceae bacterium]
MSAPVLWQYNFSNFNEKARWALDYKQVSHVRRSLLPGGPRAMAFSLGGTLPVLDLDGERIIDSTHIIAALERRFPQPALYPDDPRERAAALELEDFFDEQAGHELRRAGFYEWRSSPRFVSDLLSTGRGRPTRALMRVMLPGALLYARRRYRIYPADAERARAKLTTALDRIMAERKPSGYLVGEGFSVADLTAAALLFPLALPSELQYPYPEFPDFGELTPHRRHPAMDWIREIYRRHRRPPSAMPT